MPSYFAYRLPHTQECKAFEITASTTASELAIVSFEGRAHHFSFSKEIELNDVLAVLQKTELKSTTKEDYEKGFNTFLTQLKNERLDKIVLSKLKLVEGNFHPISIINQLNFFYSNTFNYLLIDSELGCWAGATPEILGTYQNGSFETMSLAGTIAEGEDWSVKEKEEQQLVTDFITSKLEGLSNQVKSGTTEEIQAGKVRHLKTNLKAKIDKVDQAESLLTALHPTPATCGLPQNESKQLILETESHDRALYTGYISIKNTGSINAFVNLRCMQLFKDNAVLYLGGGLTAKSELEREWQETERKAQTLLKVLKDQ
jgi:isochorismate synthase